MQRFDERQLALPVMERLHELTEETVFLCVRRDDVAVCIECLPGKHVQALALGLGGSLPLHAGAAPRVLLAYEPKDVQADYLRRVDLVSFTDRTPSTPSAVKRCPQRGASEGLCRERRGRDHRHRRRRSRSSITPAESVRRYPSAACGRRSSGARLRQALQADNGLCSRSLGTARPWPRPFRSLEPSPDDVSGLGRLGGLGRPSWACRAPLGRARRTGRRSRAGSVRTRPVRTPEQALPERRNSGGPRTPGLSGQGRGARCGPRAPAARAHCPADDARRTRARRLATCPARSRSIPA